MNQPNCKDKILTHGLSFFSFGIEDREFEFGSHFRFVTRHQQQVERQVIFTFLIQAFGVDSQTPVSIHNVLELAKMSDTKKSGRCLRAFLVGHFPSVKSDQLSEACRESRNREREAVDQFQAVETTYFPTLISSWRKSLQSTFSIQFPFFDPDSSKLPLQRNNSVPSRPISSIQMALSLSENKKAARNQ
jgi:hypothetical protein